MKKFTCSSNNYACGGRVESGKPTKAAGKATQANTRNPDFGKTNMSTGKGKSVKPLKG